MSGSISRTHRVRAGYAGGRRFHRIRGRGGVRLRSVGGTERQRFPIWPRPISAGSRMSPNWQDPPPGLGRGPIKHDPARPLRQQCRCGADRHPADQAHRQHQGPGIEALGRGAMQASNEEALNAATATFRSPPRRGAIRAAFRANCSIRSSRFISSRRPKEVWMIWQRDHMVRRVFLTDQHSEVRERRPGSANRSAIMRMATPWWSTRSGLPPRTVTSTITVRRTPRSSMSWSALRSSPTAKIDRNRQVDDPDTFNAPLP